MSDPIRDAIVAVLASVPDIGRIHAFERYTNQAGALAALYAFNGQLRGWFVRRVKITEDVIGQVPRETITWLIRGYMALADEAESELGFEALVERIREAFRANYRLGGAVVTTRPGEEDGIQLDDAGPVLFAGVLCHSAMLRLTTVRRLAASMPPASGPGLTPPFAWVGDQIAIYGTVNGPHLTGPAGADGSQGMDGHSPVLTWDADQIAIDGVVSGPHLTGPAGQVTAITRIAAIGGGGPYLVSADENAYSTLSLVGNRLYLMPFLIEREVQVDGLSIRLASFLSGTKIRFGLYQANPDMSVGPLLLDSGDIVPAAIGIVTAAVSATLAAGWYWASIIATSGPTVAAGLANRENILGVNGSLACLGHLYWAIAAGWSGLPPPPAAGFVQQLVNTVRPTIALRLVTA